MQNPHFAFKLRLFYTHHSHTQQILFPLICILVVCQTRNGFSDATCTRLMRRKRIFNDEFFVFQERDGEKKGIDLILSLWYAQHAFDSIKACISNSFNFVFLLQMDFTHIFPLVVWASNKRLSLELPSSNELSALAAMESRSNPDFSLERCYFHSFRAK